MKKTKEKQSARKVYQIKNNPKKSHHALGFFVFLCIAAIIVFGISYASSHGLLNTTFISEAIATYISKVENHEDTEKKENEANVIPLESGGNYRYTPYQDKVAVCGKESISIMNASGEEVFRHPMKLDVPLVSAENGAMIVASRGKTQLLYHRGKDEIKEITAKNIVTQVKMSKSGYFAVITEEVGYDGGLYIYNSQGEITYIWMSGTGRIIDVDISPSGKLLAVSLMDVSSGSVNGNILFFHNGVDERAYAGANEQDNLISTVKWMDDRTLLAVGDSQLLCINSDGKKKWSWDYEGKSLLSYNVDRADMPVFALSSGSMGTNRSCEIVMMNKQGKKSDPFQIDTEMKNISTSSGKAAVVCAREVIMLDRYAKEKSRTALKKDVSCGTMFGSGNKMLAVSGAMADVITIK